MRRSKRSRAAELLCAAPAILSMILLVPILPILAGFQGYVVASASMNPAIPKNSVVFVKKESFSEIEEGDVITYQVGEDAMIVTHRVVSVNRLEKYFRTKGDANSVQDGGKIYFSQVKGVVAAIIPWGGLWIGYLGSWQGKIVLLLLLAALTYLADFLTGCGGYQKKSAFRRKKGDVDQEYGLEKRKMGGNSGCAASDGFCFCRDDGGIFEQIAGGGRECTDGWRGDGRINGGKLE